MESLFNRYYKHASELSDDQLMKTFSNIDPNDWEKHDAFKANIVRRKLGKYSDVYESSTVNEVKIIINDLLKDKS